VAVAGILAALLDKLTDGPDTRDKRLGSRELSEYESDTLTDTERATVDRMRGASTRVAASISRTAPIGLSPSPSRLAGSALPTSWGRADYAHRR
jgi:hypothetical protein